MAVDKLGLPLDTWQGPNSGPAWQEVRVWASQWGIEGTGNYGQGLAHPLLAAEETVQRLEHYTPITDTPLTSVRGGGSPACGRSVAAHMEQRESWLEAVPVLKLFIVRAVWPLRKRHCPHNPLPRPVLAFPSGAGRTRPLLT